MRPPFFCSPPPRRPGSSGAGAPRRRKSIGARHTQSGTSRSAHQPPDHGGRICAASVFLFSAASPRLFRHPLRHPVRHYPPHTQTVAYPTTQASNTRLPHDLLSGAQTNRPHTPPAAPPRAPLPDRHKKAAPGTGTATLHPHPRPHHPPPEPAGKKHPLPATSSTSAPPGKAPPRTSLRPHAPARTREKLRSPPPHIRILAHLHLSPTPCSRAPPKLPHSPPRNARKNVTPHPAGRLPAPSRTSKCLPSPAGTKKAAAR